MFPDKSNRLHQLEPTGKQPAGSWLDEAPAVAAGLSAVSFELPESPVEPDDTQPHTASDDQFEDELPAETTPVTEPRTWPTFDQLVFSRRKLTIELNDDMSELILTNIAYQGLEQCFSDLTLTQVTGLFMHLATMVKKFDTTFFLDAEKLTELLTHTQAEVKDHYMELYSTTSWMRDKSQLPPVLDFGQSEGPAEKKRTLPEGMVANAYVEVLLKIRLVALRYAYLKLRAEQPLVYPLPSYK